jgi:hypothetical protein
MGFKLDLSETRLNNVDCDMKRENQLEATQWFIELMIPSTCFGHYYTHHQELETIQMFTACDT